MHLNNKNDSRIEIIPADESNRAALPPSVAALLPLPLGAFVMKNNTDVPITAVFAIWTMTAPSGFKQQHTLACDGYFLGAPKVIVKGHDFSLVTQDGYQTHDSVSNLASQSHASSVLERTRSASQQQIDIALTIDSAIFMDGQIWGPDQRKYYLTISKRYFAVKSIINDITDAKSSGQDVSDLLRRIRVEGHGNKDEHSKLRGEYAGLLVRSPNREGTLNQFKEHAAPPEFSHIGDSK